MKFGKQGKAGNQIDRMGGCEEEMNLGKQRKAGNQIGRMGGCEEEMNLGKQRKAGRQRGRILRQASKQQQLPVRLKYVHYFETTSRPVEE
ncbi:hypothetical protein Pcinc_044138 [Petrolisthes cinctipes]|uniref:Uncharacterized protein n=1 Tax=Petrolisthes cinctipes TaxID=88211 RepID=A0AAE1BHE2_PETCI|nr:hypothetical protein Pcinc_044138 [Petrolisthes cinctipes]